MQVSKSPFTNGAGRRKLPSWIDSFVDYTSNLESAPIWRKWSAISAISAVLERRVYVTTSAPLYPNLYTFLVGDPGLGKTRPISAVRGFLEDIPDFHIAPTSVTMASLVDNLNEAKRTVINLPNPAIEYNTIMILADELSAFMHEYSGDLVAGLTTFFDCVPYGQGRRVGNLKIKIKNPQLNILSGTTPSNLLKFIPDGAWEQGFTSRILLIFATKSDCPIIDVFNTPFREKPKDMIHDFKLIASLHGEFGWTEEFAMAMHNWKLCNFDPVPKHPKLTHYNSRRFAHLLKLAMVASVDRDSSLVLDRMAFNKAMGWMLEAEAQMPAIFSNGAGGADSKAMDEILHFIQITQGEMGVSEHHIVRHARRHIEYANNIIPILNVMEISGIITAVGQDDRTKLRLFKASTLQ